jgi:hypothetical protein
MANSASYGLKKLLSSQHLGTWTKYAVGLIRPILTHGSKRCPLKRKDENMIRI